MNPQRTVLVISDAPEQFTFTAKMLRQDGLEVRFKTSLFECLTNLGHEVPQLIVSELARPNLDGLQLCRLVRTEADLARVPIVLVGDLSKQSSIVRDSFKCGAAGYIQKPIDALELSAFCRSLLERNTQRRWNDVDDLFDALLKSAPGITRDRTDDRCHEHLRARPRLVDFDSWHVDHDLVCRN